MISIYVSYAILFAAYIIIVVAHAISCKNNNKTLNNFYDLTTELVKDNIRLHLKIFDLQKEIMEKENKNDKDNK